jgi:hypothetical protein
MFLPNFSAEASLYRGSHYSGTTDFILQDDKSYIQPQLSVLPIACLTECRIQYSNCIRVLGSRFECQNGNRACISSCIRGSRF